MTRRGLGIRRTLNRAWANGYTWYRKRKPPRLRAAPATQSWAPLTNTKIRLGLGPANFAGQAAMFAHAVSRNLPDVSVEVVTYKRPDTLDYPSDVTIDSSTLNRRDVQRAQVRRIAGRYTHVLVDAFRPLFGRLYGTDIGADIPALTRANVRVGLLAHGSDVRDPRRHIEREPQSLFRDAPVEVIRSLILTTERNRRLAKASGLPVFVTTPDLLVDLPWAVWAPLVVDVTAWANHEPAQARRRPVVLHAPSRRWTKGTERILPVLIELDERRSIELRLAEGVSRRAIPNWIRAADIVVDQFGTGSYGVLSCEAMAAGKPVVAYLSDPTIAAIGETPPIVNATAATLQSVIESLLADPAETAAIGDAGRTYVRVYHDGAMTARALATFLR